MENWQSSYQKILVLKGQEASIFIEEAHSENEIYLVSSGHPTDGILLLGYFNSNRLTKIYNNEHIEVIQGARNTPLKIRSTVYGNAMIYFVPLGHFTKRLQMEIKNI